MHSYRSNLCVCVCVFQPCYRFMDFLVFSKVQLLVLFSCSFCFQFLSFFVPLLFSPVCFGCKGQFFASFSSVLKWKLRLLILETFPFFFLKQKQCHKFHFTTLVHILILYSLFWHMLSKQLYYCYAHRPRTLTLSIKIFSPLRFLL